MISKLRIFFNKLIVKIDEDPSLYAMYSIGIIVLFVSIVMSFSLSGTVTQAECAAGYVKTWAWNQSQYICVQGYVPAHIQ